LLLLTGAAPAPSGCAADADLGYVCGAERPEDILPLPQTRWLVASGFARGAGLKLVDAPARTLAK
jgi:hypothetical protein